VFGYRTLLNVEESNELVWLQVQNIRMVELCGCVIFFSMATRSKAVGFYKEKGKTRPIIIKQPKKCMKHGTNQNPYLKQDKSSPKNHRNHLMSTKSLKHSCRKIMLLLFCIHLRIVSAKVANTKITAQNFSVE